MIMFASISEGECVIENPLVSDDTSRTIGLVKSLGARIEDEKGVLKVVSSKNFKEPSEPIFCGNSGTTVRLGMGLIAREDVFAILYGDGSLSARPMSRIVEPLSRLGAEFFGKENASKLPIAMRGGSLNPTTYESRIPSAQVKSAFILAALSADGTSTYKEPGQSRDHTERFLEAFGAVESKNGTLTIKPSTIKPFKTRVTGDFSSAAFFLTLGACHPDARIEMEGVGLNSTRTGFLKVLERMGAKAEITDLVDDIEPHGRITVESSDLEGIEITGEDVATMVDEVPLIAVLGAFAKGRTTIRGASELRKKESDRIKGTVLILSKMGAAIEELEDGFSIEGGAVLHPAGIDSFADHRMAMLAAIAGVCAKGVTVSGAESVSISYPGFFKDLEGVMKI